MINWKRFSILPSLILIAPFCAFPSGVYTDRASWEAAVQSAGYSLVAVDFSTPSDWTPSHSQNFAIGLTSHATTNGMSISIESSGFGVLTSAIHIQDDSVIGSDQASKPELDTLFTFGDPVYGFAADFNISCPANDPLDCASMILGGPESSGFWGFADPGSGSTTLFQGIEACPGNVNCHYKYSISNLEVAVASPAVATPEPGYFAPLLILAGASWALARRRSFAKCN